MFDKSQYVFIMWDILNQMKGFRHGSIEEIPKAWDREYNFVLLFAKPRHVTAPHSALIQGRRPQ